VETWVRRAVCSHSRRLAVLSLGSAALAAALGRPVTAEAGSCNKKSKKRCKQLGTSCEIVVRAFCTGADPGGNGCLQRLMPCCTPLETCDATASTQCFVDRFPKPV
jgi:hypothetical protein